MENSQIWLKPKPTHIDEYFEDFLSYLLESGGANDSLYMESIRLLKERVSQLIEERTTAPMYRQDKDPEVLKFNIRLCGAWLLTFPNAPEEERKQVLLTIINSLIFIALQSKITGLNNRTLANKSVPDLFEMGLKLATHRMPEKVTFTLRDLTNFSVDQFILKFLSINISTPSNSYYEGRGLMRAKEGKMVLASFQKEPYNKVYSKNSNCETDLLPEYGISVCTESNLQIKKSQRGDIVVVEEFVNNLLERMKGMKRLTSAKKNLKTYLNGDEVPVEVVESSPQKIVLKTIDPSYNEVTGQLIFEQNLKIFSKVYPIEVWCKVLRVGTQFSAIINCDNRSFSITELFTDFISDSISVDDCYDANNFKNEGAWVLKLREFWLENGFMTFVNLSEEEDRLLDSSGGNACIEITEIGKEGQYRGCLYGEVRNYNVKTHDITREKVCPEMLTDFIKNYCYPVFDEPLEEEALISPAFIKEYCYTLNLLQSNETDPMLRYRILSVMRLLSLLIENKEDSSYCLYIAKDLKTLILFAQADSNEGDIVTPIEAPEGLKDEENVTNGTDILKILSCFAKKDDEATSGILDPYIEGDNELLSKSASLVQSYNRLSDLLEVKTLRGIKKEILNRLSVVLEGDSTLELTKEVEGIYGEEDDMKEFKTSFFEAPSNAKEQRQFYNVFRGICAMMNNRGGVLYLGVNDKGAPVGLQNDLEKLASQHNRLSTLDAFIIYISQQGEQWFGETYWKYVTIKPIREYNILSILVDPYPYDIVFMKDNKAYLRKNNASAPITDQETIEDIRRQRQRNLRKTDDKMIILQDAIQKERKVRLMGYRSSNSGEISNRVVEAFYIDSNEYLHCYEPASEKVKVFRLSRADRVSMLDDPWENKQKHQRVETDPFHMSGDTKTHVKLRLKLRAKNAIEEQYPLTAQHIKTGEDKETWILETDVLDLYPLMAFYLSHAEYVEIIEGKGLREAAIEYVKKHLKL